MGGSGGCRCRNSGGKSSIRIGSAVAESEEDELGWAVRRDDMRSRFSGVKDCQKGGGAGKAAARTFCCCCSSISVLLPWPQAARDDLDPAIRISRVDVHATAFEWCWWW